MQAGGAPWPVPRTDWHGAIDWVYCHRDQERFARLHPEGIPMRDAGGGHGERGPLAVACAIPLRGALAAVALLLASAQAPAADCAPVARLVSLQGSIDVRRAESEQWSPAAADADLCAGDALRVGERSRAALRLANQSHLRLDQNSTLTLARADEGTAFVDLLRGTLNVITRTPKPFKVRTPFVNAGIEGTEFLVRVDADSAQIAVFEGMVSASNDRGAVALSAGELAVADRSANAPRRERIVRPADAVQWALYYPSIIGAAASEDAALREADSLARRGRTGEAFARLDAVLPEVRDARHHAYRAELLLLVGRVEEARAEIARALAGDHRSGDARALQAVIAVVQNDAAAALRLARAAVEASPSSPVAWLALSYAEQARFDIPAALTAALQASESVPDNAFAWARVAELRMASGDLEGALAAAQRGSSAGAELARARTVLGFAHLTRIDTAAARREFARAIELDQADPLPRLGLGLARIRDGELVEGREQIEVAASLDPLNSLVRSYLGKAYFEERRDELAASQFDLAKAFDPKDPTPWFYDAIRKQSRNRPVEALRDLQRSIELNDNRAVYRSRLLLDEDNAARLASLARTYEDVGFPLLALLEAHEAVAADPAEFSAHAFLADSYLGRARHELASASELLQSQLLQPAGVVTNQLQLSDSRRSILFGAGPATTGMNEFNPLFLGNRWSARITGIYGNFGTSGDQVVLSRVQDALSLSFGQFHYKTDGPREGSDSRKNLYALLGHARLSDAVDIHLELRRNENDLGDVALRFDPTIQSFLVRDKLDLLRVGGSLKLARDLRLIAWIGRQERDGVTEYPRGTSFVLSSGRDTAYEAQLLGRTQIGTFLLGVGGIRLRGQTVFRDPDFGDFVSDVRQSGTNQYAYFNVDRLVPTLAFGLGISRERVDDPLLAEALSAVSPKLGITWRPIAGVSIRAATVKGLRRSLLAGQSLEPTQVAGFNQLFDDSTGSRVRRSALGIDFRHGGTSFLGMELSERKVKVAQALLDPILFYEWPERELRAYWFWTPTARVTTSLEYVFERIERPLDFMGTEAFALARTHQVPIGLNFFNDAAVTARLEATYYRQTGTFVDQGAVVEGGDTFWLADLSVSYRLPRRLGIATLEARNIFDKRFRFQETNFAIPTVSPRRVVAVRLDLTF